MREAGSLDISDKLPIAQAARELKEFVETTEDLTVEILRHVVREKALGLLVLLDRNLPVGCTEYDASSGKISKYLLFSLVIDKMVAGLGGEKFAVPYLEQSPIIGGAVNGSLKTKVHDICNEHVEGYFLGVQARAIVGEVEDEKMVLVFKALEEFMLRPAFGDLNSHFLGTKERLKQGFGTALGFMADMAKIVQEVVARDFPAAANDPDILIEAYNSVYPIVLKFAMLMLERIIYLQGYFSKEATMLPSFFRAQRNDVSGKIKIICDREMITNSPELIDLMKGPRIGCPAQVDFGGGSAIKVVFDKFKGLLEDYFRAIG